MPSPHCAVESWQLWFHSENASDVFQSPPQPWLESSRNGEDRCVTTLVTAAKETTIDVFRRKLKAEVSFWKRIKCCSLTLVTLLLRSWKTPKSLAVLDLCRRKTLSGKFDDYRDYTVYEKLHFQNWCVPSTRKQIRRFQIPLVRRAFLKSFVFVTD